MTRLRSPRLPPAADIPRCWTSRLLRSLAGLRSHRSRWHTRSCSSQGAERVRCRTMGMCLARRSGCHPAAVARLRCMDPSRAKATPEASRRRARSWISSPSRSNGQYCCPALRRSRLPDPRVRCPPSPTPRRTTRLSKLQVRWSFATRCSRTAPAPTVRRSRPGPHSLSPH